MAVYKRTYKSYDGPLTVPMTRFLVLQRYAFRSVFKSRMLDVGFMACFIPGLIMICMLYLNQNSSLLGTGWAEGRLFKNQRFDFHELSGLSIRPRGNSHGVHRPHAGSAGSGQRCAVALYEPAVFTR